MNVVRALIGVDCLKIDHVTHHLELKTHANLPARRRSLWPVRLLRDARKVCVDYPNYPSYDVHIDMLDDTYDGIYHVAPCGGN